ncbi:stonustoxin subunit alpha-like [Boleophthalmus pectinirostris]|uniref:stonustoxin subunit alpha-like n=1 Tax=Boleophthalmus pectinirostris TaxID=150288 RepID=UPI002432FA39|nr:stonustoxin subunit alpha-like [Boleophthalmus pectinirostris]
MQTGKGPPKKLSGCQVSKSGCASLVSALSSGGSCLKELDLSYNCTGGSEAQQLTALFNHPQKKLNLEHGGEERLQKDFRKYACFLTFDQNTANKMIKFSNNERTISLEKEKQSYPDHSERFDYWKQVLCAEGLRGRSYWEVETRGDVYIAVTYKSIRRRGTGDESCLGKNEQSWSLGCTEDTCSVLHKNRRRSLKRSAHRVGVYLDWEGGVLSFYDVSSDQKIHLQTFKTRFTEEVYPAFRIKTKPSDSSVTLCPV